MSTALWLLLTLGWAVAEARRAPRITPHDGLLRWLPIVSGGTLFAVTVWGLSQPGGAVWGAALLAAGVWLRIAALDALGDRFRHHVELLPDHRLETGGPYGVVRHPSELGLLLIGLGTGVLLGSPWAGWALVPPTALRVRAEDRLLARAFGSAWVTWAGITPALVPSAARRAGRGSPTTR